MGAPVLYLCTTPSELRTVRFEVMRKLDELGFVVLHLDGEAPDVAYQQRLRTTLSRCDGIVQLLGISYGPEVDTAEGRDSATRCSRAELEYRTAREMSLPCRSFVLGEDFPYEESLEGPDPSGLVLQYRYRSVIQASGDGWELIRDKAELVRRVDLLPGLFQVRTPGQAQSSLPFGEAVVPARVDDSAMQGNAASKKRGNKLASMVAFVALSAVAAGALLIAKRGVKLSYGQAHAQTVSSDSDPAGADETGTATERELVQAEALQMEILRLATLLGAWWDSTLPRDLLASATRLVKKRHGLNDATYSKGLQALIDAVEKETATKASVEARRKRILCHIATWELEQALVACADLLRDAADDRDAIQRATLLLGQVHQLMGDDAQAAVQYAEVFKGVDKTADPERWCNVVQLVLVTGFRGGELDLVYDLLSEKTCREILDLREQQSGKDSLEVMTALRIVARHSDHFPRRPAEAMEHLRRALSICEACKEDRDTPEIARVCMDLAETMQSMASGNHDAKPSLNLSEIQPLQVRALRSDESWYGNESLQVSDDLTSQAQTFEAAGQPEKAEELYRKAITICKTLGDERNAPVTGLARVLAATSRSEEAESLLQAEVERRLTRKQLPYLQKAVPFEQLARIYERQGDVVKLEPLLRQALAVACPEFGPAAIMRAALVKMMIDLLLDSNREDEAIPLMRENLKWLALAYGETDWVIPIAVHHLAQALANTGRTKEAEEEWSRGITLMEKQPRETHVTLCAMLHHCGKLYLQTRRAEEGVKMLRRAVDVDLYCKDHEGKGLSALVLNQHLTDTGKYDEAIDLMDEALEMMVKARGNRDDRTILCLYCLSHSQMRGGYLEDAKGTLELTLKCYEDAKGPDDPYVADVLRSLSVVQKKLGLRAEEERTLRRILGIRARIQFREKDGDEELQTARRHYVEMLARFTRLTRSQVEDRMRKIEAGEEVADLALKP